MQKSIIIGIASSVVLFFIGYMTFSSFFAWSLPVHRDAPYISTAINFHFTHSLVFGIALSLIPMAIVLTWKFADIFSAEKKLYSSLLIIAITILAALIRYRMIRVMVQKKAESGHPYEYGIPPGKVNIEIYMIIGLMTGMMITCFLFYRRKEKTPAFSFETSIKEQVSKNEN